MKHAPSLLLIIVMTATTSFGQSVPDSLSLLDKNFHRVFSADSARYLMRLQPLGDSGWQRDVYNIWGPMITSRQSKDMEGKQLNGRFVDYRSNGYVDSTGDILDGRQNGDWYFVNDTGRTYLHKRYESGKLVYERDLLNAKKDSLQSDSTKDEIVLAEFRGGRMGWRHYLSTRLRFPERAIMANKEGTVVVQFLVNKEGGTDKVYLFRSIEFSLDREAMRLITQSPTWTPATKNGEPVQLQMRQPIVFRLN